MPPSPLRVAIAGCGEVSQVIHLPTLANMSHLYKVVTLSDVSDQALQHCQKKWGIESIYSDFYQMLKVGDFDVVFILTADEYHTPYAVAAADAGKAVFIEKPMSLTHEDAKSIIEAEERNKVPIMVGYMRRYAEAFNVFKKMVGELKSIDYCRVRDIIGENDFFVQQSGTYPIKTSDFSPSANEDRITRSNAISSSALPSRSPSPRDVSTYRLLGSLGSHDLSAMRELLGGIPKSCFVATRNSDPDGKNPFITALLEYEGFTAIYETGIDKVGVFDASIEVCGDGKRLRLDYDTPYVKGLPITINVRETDENGHYVEKTIRPTYTDAYTLELEELHKVITEGKECKTSPKDAAEDLKIFDMIMNNLRN
ncbi:Gfo/Idh/MocA family oxidoreductase [Sporobolomyces salmoneus]|uniref:Gfo/Idh/MocA family oxidoreductase n=1 Tax=Sporobolomyces salmoneus TaxID=183962 RepID=UPI0031817879